MQNKTIYISGDSFIAGEELSDDTTECWKTYYGSYISRNIKLPNEDFYTIFMPHLRKEISEMSEKDLERYVSLKKQRTFWYRICEKNNIAFHTDALGGCAQDSLLHRAILSFNEFKKNNKKIDLALIGLCPYDRYTVYADNISSRNNFFFNTTTTQKLGFDISIQTNFIPRNNIPYHNLAKAILDMEKEKGNMVRYLTNLSLIKSFFKEKTGKNPIFIDPWNANTGLYDKDLLKIPEYKLMVESFLEDITILSMENSRTNPSSCPGGHHTPDHHAKFAEDIESIILSQL